MVLTLPYFAPFDGFSAGSANSSGLSRTRSGFSRRDERSRELVILFALHVAPLLRPIAQPYPEALHGHGSDSIPGRGRHSTTQSHRCVPTNTSCSTDSSRASAVRSDRCSSLPLKPPPHSPVRRDHPQPAEPT